MIKMKKLHYKQQEKFDLIREYLKTNIGISDGLLLNHNIVTRIYSLKKLYMNDSGIYISGKSHPLSNHIKHKLFDRKDIKLIYYAGLEGDNDFNIFIKFKNKK